MTCVVKVDKNRVRGRPGAARGFGPREARMCCRAFAGEAEVTRLGTNTRFKNKTCSEILDVFPRARSPGFFPSLEHLESTRPSAAAGWQRF